MHGRNNSRAVAIFDGRSARSCRCALPCLSAWGALPMDELEILDVLRRRAWMILLLALVATLTGYAGTFLYPEKYTATALVLVRPQEPIKMEIRSTSKEFLDFPIGPANVETPNKTY